MFPACGFEYLHIQEKEFANRVLKDKPEQIKNDESLDQVY